MSLFRSRLRLHAPEGTSDEAIDYHSVRYLTLLVRDKAVNTMQLLSETVEWRTDKELKNLSSDAADLDMRAPVSWLGWMNAFTNLFSPANRILLPRTIANLKQVAGESVTDCASFKLTRGYSLKPNALPLPTSLLTSMVGRSFMATFEGGLLPQIRVELIRGDQSMYRASHTRAKKHESNVLRGPTPPLPNPDHVRSGPYWYRRWYDPRSRSPADHLDGQHREGYRQPTAGDARPAQERHVRRDFLQAVGQGWPLREPGPRQAPVLGIAGAYRANHLSDADGGGYGASSRDGVVATTQGPA